MRRKSGSNLCAVFTCALGAMFLRFIIALSYVLYMSLKITKSEVSNTEEPWIWNFRKQKTGDIIQPTKS